MPIFILSIIIQVALVVHIVKTGRNTIWIWIVVMLPLAGSIAYLIVEILPTVGESRTARKAKRTIGDVINPNKDLKGAVRDLSVSDTIENNLKLADECIRKEMYEEAKMLFEKSLRGINKSDPRSLSGLAFAEFNLKNHKKTLELLDFLIEENPEYKNPGSHLLYARNLVELNEIEKAKEEFEVLDSYYPGPEATYWYSKLLNNLGDTEKSQLLLEKIIKTASTSGKHYNDIHKKWVKLARNAYKN